jgi:hypothetical protein
LLLLGSGWITAGATSDGSVGTVEGVFATTETEGYESDVEDMDDEPLKAKGKPQAPRR